MEAQKFKSAQLTTMDFRDSQLTKLNSWSWWITDLVWIWIRDVSLSVKSFALKYSIEMYQNIYEMLP